MSQALATDVAPPAPGTHGAKMQLQVTAAGTMPEVDSYTGLIWQDPGICEDSCSVHRFQASAADGAVIHPADPDALRTEAEVTWTQVVPAGISIVGAADGLHCLKLRVDACREKDGAVCMRFSFLHATSTHDNMFLQEARIGLDPQRTIPQTAATSQRPQARLYLGQGALKPGYDIRV